ncbi:unnamed protein product [Prorocentrum cordatum]|uniref:Uncharacterized protein n=1 Tax=Prorocentrum cordatum TaxID=2364126 RepID=A0ABN9R4U2_9DINO|nr:unnamed protein product [Polarella glacialis]
MLTCNLGGWLEGVPSRVTTVSFDPRVMATRSVYDEALQKPMKVVLHPPEEEIPWPARLVQMPSSGEGTSSEAPAFQPKTKTQRRRMQRAIMRDAVLAVLTSQGAPQLSHPAPQMGLGAGGPGIVDHKKGALACVL